jgi:hypothetical protein
MNSSEIRTAADLTEAIRLQTIIAHTGQEAVARLLRTAFRDDAVVAKFANQIALRGPTKALNMVRGTDDLPRWLWFGRLRGGFLNREERIQAEAALAELPAALHDLQRNQDHLRDLERTRESLVVARDRDELQTWLEDRRRERAPAQERGKDRSRERE